MRLLDLFCGAGGAAMGYYRAGFDEIVGVDNRPMPRYPFAFVLADALEYVAAHGHEFDAIHASPPCPHYAVVTRWRRSNWSGENTKHPALIEPTRKLLKKAGIPYVIENVRTPALIDPFMLCGTMFSINVRRHRYFETNWKTFELTPSCHHNGELPFMHKNERAYANALGCEWMNNIEARQAIPPAYTEYIGKHLLEHIHSCAT